MLASRRAALHDIMALSYGPARGLAYDRRRGFRAWVDCDDRHRRNFCLVRCNALKHVQALPTMPLHDGNTADAPLQERGKSRKFKSCFPRDQKPPQNGYSTESGLLELLVNASEYNNFPGTQPIPGHCGIYLVLPGARCCAASLREPDPRPEGPD